MTLVVGFLSSLSLAGTAHLVAAFHDGLSEAGFIDGRNVALEYRWADGQYQRLPELAADLVRRRVAAITAIGPPAALAAKALTTTIPIVFTSGSDPVKLGLVDSLSRPGGNVTGVSLLTSALGKKRMELLLELRPGIALLAFLVNPNYVEGELELAEVQASARSRGLPILIVKASAEDEFEAAFAALVQQKAGALIVASDPFFNSRRDRLVALAARHAVPAIYEWREFAVAGGLMSYGTNLAEVYRLAGTYTGSILKGAKPANLPVQQPTKFELVINVRTAKAIGLTIPESIFFQATEVIE